MKLKKLLASLLALALSVTALASCGKTEKTYITLPEDFGSEEYAIGFRPGDVALAKEVQRMINRVESKK